MLCNRMAMPCRLQQKLLNRWRYMLDYDYIYMYVYVYIVEISIQRCFNYINRRSVPWLALSLYIIYIFLEYFYSNIYQVERERERRYRVLIINFIMIIQDISLATAKPWVSASRAYTIENICISVELWLGYLLVEHINI